MPSGPSASSTQPPETYSWIPFGGGTRRCIGAAFAQFEMRVVLRTVLRIVELRAASDAPEGIVRRNVPSRRGTGRPRWSRGAASRPRGRGSAA